MTAQPTIQPDILPNILPSTKPKPLPKLTPQEIKEFKSALKRARTRQANWYYKHNRPPFEFPDDEAIADFLHVSPHTAQQEQEQGQGQEKEQKKAGRPPIIIDNSAMRDRLFGLSFARCIALDNLFVGAGRLFQSKKDNTKDTSGPLLFNFFKTYSQISSATIKEFWECGDDYVKKIFPQIRVAHLALERLVQDGRLD
ncbi:hypothetical protein [Aeromonas veronii]|uniref:hypothetical protein n=1 Tax=Aeromonas veronii TaxID=654 RepID=UPI000B5A0C30|nr:hypothetical protein [Aeromonas veronii]